MSFLTEDGTVFIQSQALVDTFIQNFASFALHLTDVQRAIRQSVDPFIFRDFHPISEPRDRDGEFSTCLAV